MSVTNCAKSTAAINPHIPVNKAITPTPHKPQLIVIAGPNGSGKTTTIKKIRAHRWMDNTAYINADDIAQQYFEDWNNPESTLKAAKMADNMRNTSVLLRSNFAFETVFSTDGKVDFLRSAKDKGYFVRLFFICTQKPEINVSRVAIRVKKGGHNVPEDKIRKRYYKSIEQCEKVIAEMDRCYVYDNSVNSQDPTLLFRTVDGQIEKQYVSEIPDWSQNLFDKVNKQQ